MTATAAHRGSAAPAPTPGRQALILAVFLVLCLGVEYATSLVTRPAIEPWYRALAKPDWTPPDIAFPIVWTVLFVLMALAAWQAWRRAAPGTFGWPLACFLVQLALNGAWSFIFFGRGDPRLALIDLVALLLALIATTIAFWRLSRPAGAMLLPYLAWVVFAGVLNFEVARLNP